MPISFPKSSFFAKGGRANRLVTEMQVRDLNQFGTKISACCSDALPSNAPILRLQANKNRGFKLYHHQILLFANIVKHFVIHIVLLGPSQTSNAVLIKKLQNTWQQNRHRTNRYTDKPLIGHGIARSKLPTLLFHFT